MKCAISRFYLTGTVMPLIRVSFSISSAIDATYALRKAYHICRRAREDEASMLSYLQPPRRPLLCICLREKRVGWKLDEAKNKRCLSEGLGVLNRRDGLRLVCLQSLASVKRCKGVRGLINKAGYTAQDAPSTRSFHPRK